MSKINEPKKATINTYQALDDLFDTIPTNTELMTIDVGDEYLVEDDEESDEVGNDLPCEKDLQSDYKLARKTIRTLLGKSEAVIENMLNIAIQTESANGFAVAGNLIKQMSELSKDLVGLHKSVNDISTKSKKDAPKKEITNQQNIQQNVIFSGSTSDLLKQLKKTNIGE